ncbi:MAG TPA: hypothetical protein VGI96_40065 [Streptosporangiaceae bacterium]
MNQAQIISNTIKQFRENVPDYVGCGFVDLSTGMLLDVDTVEAHPREILDVVAAATAHLFEGRNVVQIEGLWKQYRGQTEGGHYFKEILVNSDHLVHLFMRSTSDPDIVAAVICTREVRVGMLFAQARQVMREYDVTSSRPREYEAASPAPREYEAARPEPREYEAASHEPREYEAASPARAYQAASHEPREPETSDAAEAAGAEPREPGAGETAGAEPLAANRD